MRADVLYDIVWCTWWVSFQLMVVKVLRLNRVLESNLFYLDGERVGRVKMLNGTKVVR